MHAQNTRKPRRPALRPLIAALATTTSCAAWAEDPSPWYLGASVSVTRDSNVFRVPDGPGDTYTTTSLLGGFDQAISRQRFYGSARVGYSKYQQQDNLDNVGYGLAAGWDWATIEKLTGNVNVSANRSLASLNGNSTRPTRNRNMLSNEQVSTGVRWGGDGLLSLFANYGHGRVRYSAAEYITSEGSSDTVSVGTNYRLGGSTTVGVAVRLTRTANPHGEALTIIPSGPEDFTSVTDNGRNLDLLADWTYTAQTRVSGRLSLTRQTYSGAASNRDFSGVTGSISGNYAPTAKLAFTALLQRDAGNNAAYFSTANSTTGATSIGLSQSSTSSNLAQLGATYAATAKIGVSAGLLYRRSNLTGGGSDALTQWSLGTSYAIARNWQLGCNLSRESRSYSGISGLDYNANTVGCSAQFTLR